MSMYMKPEQIAEGILYQIMQELNVSNVLKIGYTGSVWVVKYHKGEDDHFETFYDMYSFLKTENN